jgi:hydrogenase nickel incorporation protein HypA/HybF
MHEFALAQTLLETAAADLPAGQVQQVTKVWVKLGPLAGVSTEELQFGFAVAAAGTPFAQAQLVIEPTPLMVYCPRCAVNHALEQTEPLSCPVCGFTATQVVGGKEVVLQSLEFVQSQ